MDRPIPNGPVAPDSRGSERQGQGRRAADRSVGRQHLASDQTQRLLAVATEVMAVDEYTRLEQPSGGVVFRGALLSSPNEALHAAGERLGPMGYLALLERRDGQDLLTVVPHEAKPHRTRPWLALALLALTILSSLYVGSTWVQENPDSLARNPIAALLAGLPFAASLLAILGTHEMGHFLTARHYGVQVSLPYFIPMPFGPFGTMGAFINMRSVPANRRQLLRIGLAGPLSGLAVALVVVLLGLRSSHLEVMPPGQTYLQEGNSILYLLLKYLVFGRWLPDAGLDVNLSPVGFAGWAGLLVTGLNLIPAAQLDGGHVAYALFGRQARLLTYLIGGALLLTGFFWSGWFLWAVLILWLGSRKHVILDDVTPLTRGQRVLAVAGLVLFALLFVPIPLIVAGA